MISRTCLYASRNVELSRSGAKNAFPSSGAQRIAGLLRFDAVVEASKYEELRRHVQGEATVVLSGAISITGP